MRIYLCPALLDAILFLVAFAVNYGIGRRGEMTAGQCAWVMGTQQLTYMAFSLISGLALTRRNARPVLLASAVASAAAAVFCLAATAFRPLIAGMALLGATAAFFFNAFQSFMRGEAAPGELRRATALYTAAWSGGSAIGFIASGALFDLGPAALGGATALVVGIVLAVLLRHGARPPEAPSADEHTDASPHGTPETHATYVWIGWMMIFTAVMVQRPLLTFYPVANARMAIPPALASLPLFLHMLLQGLFGLRMGRLRTWFYRPGPLIAMQGGGAALLLALFLASRQGPTRAPVLWAFTAAGVAALGICCGFAYFCAVYYSSNTGRRARNVGVNECLVGMGSFVGLFVCAWFQERGAAPDSMYAVCAVVLAVSVALQWAVAFLGRTRPPALTRPRGQAIRP